MMTPPASVGLKRMLLSVLLTLKQKLERIRRTWPIAPAGDLALDRVGEAPGAKHGDPREEILSREVKICL